MENQNLRQALEQLHAELQRTDSTDPKTRELLQHLINDIQNVLQDTRTESPPRYDDLRQPLADSVKRLEDSHPSLVLTIGRVLDNLARV